MSTNYLQMVNNVLTRLRENTVTSVGDTPYSSLIGVFVNDAKREVEDAYDWNALDTTIIVNAVANTRSYSVVGSGQRFRVQDVLNDTQDVSMRQADGNWINRQYYLSTVQSSAPIYYNFRGVDSNGDTQVEVFPKPDASYTLRFELFVPQDDLTSDADIVKVPANVVQLLAYSKAIAERGEDGGVQASEAYLMYRLALADAIAIEKNRYGETNVWTEV